MITKALYVNRTDRANQRFLKKFRASADVLDVQSARMAADSRTRPCSGSIGRGSANCGSATSAAAARRLSGPGLDAVKATIDADSVREGYG